MPPVDLVLMRKDKIVGFAFFDMDLISLDEHIYMICIDKDYRRQGLEKQFLLKIMEKHKESGMKMISLKVHEAANSASKKLYAKLGFKEVGKDIESGLTNLKKAL